jgi:hypothetical protein
MGFVALASFCGCGKADGSSRDGGTMAGSGGSDGATTANGGNTSGGGNASGGSNGNLFVDQLMVGAGRCLPRSIAPAGGSSAGTVPCSVFELTFGDDA